MRAIAIAALLSVFSSVGAADRGFFGFGLSTEVDGGFWNPVLVNAFISEVVPASPTARGGIAVGDVLLEFEGLSVPGSKGEALKKLKATLENPATVGEKRRLKLRRTNGEEYSVVLTAEPRPQ